VKCTIAMSDIDCVQQNVIRSTVLVSRIQMATTRMIENIKCTITMSDRSCYVQQNVTTMLVSHIKMATTRI